MTFNLTTSKKSQMTDPKPNLSHAAIQANINYCHSQLDQLQLKQDLIKEQLDHWLELLEKTDI